MRRLNAENHHFGGFDKGGDRLALLQSHFASRIGGDDGGDVLAADGKAHLRHQALDFDARHPADQLIAAGDAPEIRAPPGHVTGLGGAVEIFVELRFRDAMVAASGSNRLQFAFVDPLLKRGVADSQDLRGLAGFEKTLCGHESNQEKRFLIRMASEVNVFFGTLDFSASLKKQSDSK